MIWEGNWIHQNYRNLIQFSVEWQPSKRIESDCNDVKIGSLTIASISGPKVFAG